MERCYRCMRGHIVNGVCNNCKRRPPIHTAASNSKLVLQPGTPLLDGAITVGALLGKGGFGATYVADTQQFDVICLKEFLPSYMLEDERDGNALRILPDKQAIFEKSRTAFEKECKLISQLHHSNIVQVLFRFWENNTAYYGMQLLEGSDLAGFMKARKDVPMTAEVAADFIERMYPIMDALKYLHNGKKVYHRDISPSNIFLRGWNADTDKYNLNFDPCLIDFGAAFVAREDYTKSFARVKNIHYSPYEQNLSFSSLTPASDIYSLCATFYHVLTGKAPDPAMDRMVEYSESKVDPLKKPGDINPALRPLNNALMHGLAIAVQNRTSSVDQLMKELAEAVQALRSGIYNSGNEEIHISGNRISGNDPVQISGNRISGNDPVQISGNRKEDFYGTGGNPPPPPPPVVVKDSPVKSIFALLMDIFIALIFGCIPAANGYGTWTVPPLTLAVLFVINLITMLAAKRTLGQMIFGMRKRTGGAGRKILAVLVRTIVPFALVDVILSACGAYPAALCNGVPETEDFSDDVRKPETEVNGNSIPPLPPLPPQPPQPPVKPVAPPPVKPVVMQPVQPIQPVQPVKPAAPPMPKTFFIMVANYIGPNGRKMVYPLYEGFKYRVGRDAMSQIQTPDHLRTVSGYHCEIEVAGGIVRVTDHSSNGSSVENYPLEKGVTYKWKLGTTLRLADAVSFQLFESKQ